ncbi:hypothetical protein HK104_002662 [Borealophlyctis nickersoniae]|nr:hypothetical protein HK104_002662 [Borealophlyctis nickersoniae]
MATSNAPALPIVSDTSSSSKTLAEQVAVLLGTLGAARQEGMTIIALRSLAFSNIQALERVPPSLPGLFRSSADQDEDKTALFGIKGCYPIFSSRPGMTAIAIPQPWTDVCSSLKSDGRGSAKVICIVGGKNLGKSTLARVLTNSLLNTYPEVAFLDCDVGQTELTPTGFTSLHILRNPLLGPPFTHLQHPFRSFYVGASSPKHDPDYYLACICRLYDAWQAEAAVGADGRERPLIINTHGWIKGMGFDLLVHFLKHVRPASIVQMSVPQFTQGSAAKNMPHDFAAVVSGMCEQTVSVTEIPGRDDTGSRLRYSAADHRNLGLLAYFHQARFDPSAPVDSSSPRTPWWTFDEKLPGRLPYTVPWKAVRLKFLNGEVPSSQTLYALNATLVALVYDRTRYAPPPQYTEAEESNIPDDSPHRDLRIVPSQLPLIPADHNCVGLGIIRGIDPSTRTFHVLTPVAEQDLQCVNMIVRAGGVETPPWMLCAGYEHSRAHIPYTTRMASEGMGSLARRKRHNLLRRKGTRQG